MSDVYSPDQLALAGPPRGNKHYTRLDNEVAWSMTMMKRAGLLARNDERPSTWWPSQVGREVAEDDFRVLITNYRLFGDRDRRRRSWQ